MNNNSNNKQKATMIWRIVLGIIVSLLFVLSVCGILWTIGAINTTKDIIIAIFVSLVFVFVVGAVLTCAGIMNNKK